MSILKVANVHFEATGTNRIDYLGDDKIRINTANGSVLDGSTTDALLRITQTGTGDALRIEDSANPDSTPFIVDANGFVCIGATNPSTQLQQFNTTSVARSIGTSTIYNLELVGSGVVNYGPTTNHPLNLVANNATVVRLDTSGNVLISRTDSTVGLGVKLDVNGSINCSNIFVNGNAVGGGGGTTIFTANLGNGSANSFNVSHNLNNLFVIPAVREYSSGYYVYPDIKTTTPNHIVIEFVNAPSTNQYAVLVVG